MSFRKDHICFEVIQVFYQHHIRPTAGSDHAHFLAQAEMLGRIDRHHLDRRHRFKSLLDCMAQDSIHMTILGDRLSMRVIGHEQEAARIQAKLCNRAHL